VPFEDFQSPYWLKITTQQTIGNILVKVEHHVGGAEVSFTLNGSNLRTTTRQDEGIQEMWLGAFNPDGRFGRHELVAAFKKAIDLLSYPDTGYPDPSNEPPKARQALAEILKANKR
jgi:hypothetical protein